jgi:pyruvate formate lyase activating enzyme
LKEAAYYEKKNDTVRCILCPHYCVIPDGNKGICGVRENIGGTLYASTYCQVAAIAVDPIEKKPLYHFFPGREILSVGSAGCNFRCPFCQNWHLVEGGISLKEVSIEDLIGLTLTSRSLGISYTYNEPLIQWEFVYDCSKKFHEKNLKNVLVTNGFVNPDPLKELLPFVDGMNIDLKFFTEKSYKNVSQGSLAPVKNTIAIAAKECHVEVTTLVVTGLNDREDEIRSIVDFISSINPEIPFHISRYFPSYRFNAPPTDEAFMEKAYKIAREKLRSVYLGNIDVAGTTNSYCPGCGNLLVERSGYRTAVRGLTGRSCSNCGREQNFVTET